LQWPLDRAKPRDDEASREDGPEQIAQDEEGLREVEGERDDEPDHHVDQRREDHQPCRRESPSGSHYKLFEHIVDS
jgi:hypothetical protein